MSIVVAMATVPLDVGAHVGRTLQIVRQPRWGFDRIVAFEPAPNCWDILEEMSDHRVELRRFGLWNSDTTMTPHDPGVVGASMFSPKSLRRIEFRARIAVYNHRQRA